MQTRSLPRPSPKVKVCRTWNPEERRIQTQHTGYQNDHQKQPSTFFLQLTFLSGTPFLGHNAVSTRRRHQRQHNSCGHNRDDSPTPHCVPRPVLPSPAESQNQIVPFIDKTQCAGVTASRTCNTSLLPRVPTHSEKNQ